MDFLKRIKKLIKNEDDCIIYWSALEGAEKLGFCQDDMINCISSLKSKDYKGKKRSEKSDEMLYVFKPKLGTLELYIKIKLLEGKVHVLSFKSSTDRS